MHQPHGQAMHGCVQEGMWLVLVAAGIALLWLESKMNQMGLVLPGLRRWMCAPGKHQELNLPIPSHWCVAGAWLQEKQIHVVCYGSYYKL